MVATGTSLSPSRASTWPSNTASGASKTAVSMKPYQSSFNRSPPAWNRLRIVADRAAQDGGVVEEAAEEKEEQVEGDREADQDAPAARSMLN